MKMWMGSAGALRRAFALLLLALLLLALPIPLEQPLLRHGLAAVGGLVLLAGSWLLAAVQPLRRLWWLAVGLFALCLLNWGTATFASAEWAPALIGQNLLLLLWLYRIWDGSALQIRSADSQWRDKAQGPVFRYLALGGLGLLQNLLFLFSGNLPWLLPVTATAQKIRPLWLAVALFVFVQALWALCQLCAGLIQCAGNKPQDS